MIRSKNEGFSTFEDIQETVFRDANFTMSEGGNVNLTPSFCLQGEEQKMK